MKKFTLFFILLSFSAVFSPIIYSNTYKVTSPDKNLLLTIKAGPDLTYSVILKGQVIINPSPLSMKIKNGNSPGKNVRISDFKLRPVSRILHPELKVKSEIIKDDFNEAVLKTKDDFSVHFRVYNDGIAYRFVTSYKNTIRITGEKVVYNFPGDTKVYFPEEKSMETHQERTYLHINLNEINEKRFASVPLLVELAKGVKVVITEADIEDYPGIYMRGIGEKNTGLAGIFPLFPLKFKMVKDRNQRVVKHADYLAETKGKRSFPWRVMVITENDRDLITSQMIYKLAPPCELKDTSWIKPGRVAWDWWNNWNISGVNFKSGVNTQTYKHYIDFAQENGIEYIIMDEGWYELGDLMKIVPDIDLPEILTYGRKKKVGIILWVVWKTLEDQFYQAMDQFEKWGVAGLKVDFMQRDDQVMVNFYHKVAKEAAKRHMVVDFHGSYKPAGLRRTYPNVLTREGVMGLEHSKWGKDASPENALIIPFIRMVAGPLDYTPGAMINATEKNFRSVWDKPMSQGTRCHQLAMYVVYESPLQMLADNPTHYRKEKECLDFIVRTPTVWDETRVLAAKVSDYIWIARRSGDKWFLGAMTDWTPRKLESKLSFLPPGIYSMETWQDGKNAHRYASDYKKRTIRVNSQQKISIDLAPGGGWTAIITKN